MAEATDKTKNEDSSGVAKAKTESDVRPRKLCAYSQRVCNLEILKGFDFCHKHILEDKASPFKPCDFVAKSNGKRCPNPAQKLPDRAKSFCIIHTRKAELRRAVEERRKRRHQDDVEGGYDDEKGKRRRTSSSNSQRSDKLDGHSTDEDGGGSGDDYLKVDSAWHGDIDSDADSVDSEEEDLLKHAGVWTVEEATRMCRDKMIRLRSLYITQFKRLQHVLKERRRKYCQAIQAEEVEETGECNLTPTQLLGRKPQHGCPGSEALLHRQAKEKKQGANIRQQGVSNLRCTYSPGGNRCTEKVLPLTKHCIKHITHDPNQLLFQKCTFPSKGESQCERNVPNIFTHSACRLHEELPKTMKRPDISKDLDDAKERAKLRKIRATDNKEREADVSEALQLKSSVLVAPNTSDQSVDSGPVMTEPQQAAATSSIPTTQISSNSSSTTPEKMEVDNNDENAKKSPSDSASAAETSVGSSGASGPTPGLKLATESISPGLAAASLVAVCSSPQVPLQGTPLASVSGAQHASVTDSKLLPSSGDKEESVSNASTEGSKTDVESKAPEVKSAGDLTYVKENEKQVSIDPKATGASSSVANSTANDSSQKPASPGKQPDQLKITPNVVCKAKEDATQVSASTSPPASQSVTQGTTQVAPSRGTCTPGTSSKTTSPVVTKPPPTEASEKASQVVSKGTSQGASPGVLHEPPKSTSRSTSPTGPTTAKQAPLVTSASSVHPPQSTTASSSAGQSLKTASTKPVIASEMHRAAPIKTFQHLPAGMTAATSKPFRAITSIPSKETNKDTKTDPVKPQEPNTSTKL